MTSTMSMSGPPSLGESDGSAVDLSSSPDTPADMSPYINGDAYTLPLEDAIVLPRRADNSQMPLHASLPDILDANTATSVPIRHICCIGAGYVGGPTAAVLALHNPNVRVTVVDRNIRRINAWKSRHLPIHEPGLIDVVRLARDGTKEQIERNGNNAEAGADRERSTLVGVISPAARRPNLFFSTQCAETIAIADIVLISVNTPTKSRGIGAGRATDMAAIEGAVRDVAIHARPGTILVEKSTVPCKTGQLIKDILETYRPGVTFPVLSNPEFLSEGTAMRDLMSPDRVIIGCETTIAGHRAAAALANLYAAWVPRARIAPINIWSSELCKLTANAMLAQRISSINSISAICERTGADISEIAKSVGMDARIGPQFLKAGLGFGGSCFRKDIASLTYLAESLGLPEVAAYWESVLTMNNYQRDRFARHVISSLNDTLRGKKIAILGYAFKKNTGDARESPAFDVIRILLEENPAAVDIYDPLCSEADILREMVVLEGDYPILAPDGPVRVRHDPYTACADSDAVLVLTDWDMFKAGHVTAPVKPVSIAVDQLDETTPAGILRLPVRAVKPAAAPIHSISSPLSIDLLERLVPEPECTFDCEECSAGNVAEVEPKDLSTPLDWYRVANLVKEPRWVFDGRGILDSQALISLGFRLETLGRASMY